MKQNKKQNWINLLEIILISLILIFASVSFLYSQSDKYFCSKNPQSCVCKLQQEIVTTDINYINHLDFELGYECGYASDDLKTIKCFKEKCSKFRKKTQAELDIDDCNRNTRDDEKCMCEEWINTSQFCIKNNRLCSDYISIQTNPEYWNVSGIRIYINDIRIYINDIEAERTNWNFCIKSRPKTECEKGNLDWVEEEIFENKINIKSIPVDSGIGYTECIISFDNLSFNTACFQSLVTVKTYFNEEKDILSIGVFEIYNFTNKFNQTFNKIFKTICREKTDFEKLMDMDCDWLFNHLNYPISSKNKDVNRTILKVWKQKGCEI